MLPDSFWCYDPLTDGVDSGPLPALTNGYVTFGCLNHFRKINEPLLRLWAEVLSRVQDSRLLLLAPPGQARARIVDALGQRGIDSRRIAFTARCARTEYLRIYRQIDVCLDSHPYGGHTTSMDAFWMGVPVVSLVGPTVVGRAAITIAENLRLDSLVANTNEDFAAVAMALATDWDRLRELRQCLRANLQASPLMQGRRFAQALEEAYRQTFRRWCSGAPRSRRRLSSKGRRWTLGSHGKLGYSGFPVAKGPLPEGSLVWQQSIPKSRVFAPAWRAGHHGTFVGFQPTRHTDNNSRKSIR